jgi:multicomponent Na+:H+ antiporter subunit C
MCETADSSMTYTALVYALVGVGLFSVGLYALIMHAHLLRKILAINVIGSAVFLLLVALARRTGAGPPDIVPHAMVITGIVVAVSATALALMLMLKLVSHSANANLPDEP